MTTLRDLGLDQLIKIDKLPAGSTCCSANLSSFDSLASFREMSIKIEELTVSGWITNISSYPLAYLMCDLIRIMQYYFLVWITFDQGVIIGDLQTQTAAREQVLVSLIFWIIPILAKTCIFLVPRR